MRYLIYALLDPDGAVRYIGRSSTGLERVKEHATRVGRERTYKAAWIRSLQRRGLRYGVQVLEACADLESTILAEIRWIAEGRARGWRLTNLTSGGEGASVYKLQIPADEVVTRYLAGESELAIARAFNTSRGTIDRRLRVAGVSRRGRSAAMFQRMSTLSKDERRQLVSKAHATSARRPVVCGHCGSVGHNRRTCDAILDNL